MHSPALLLWSRCSTFCCKRWVAHNLLRQCHYKLWAANIRHLKGEPSATGQRLSHHVMPKVLVLKSQDAIWYDNICIIFGIFWPKKIASPDGCHLLKLSAYGLLSRLSSLNREQNCKRGLMPTATDSQHDFLYLLINNSRLTFVYCAFQTDYKLDSSTTYAIWARVTFIRKICMYPGPESKMAPQMLASENNLCNVTIM